MQNSNKTLYENIVKYFGITFMTFSVLQKTTCVCVNEVGKFLFINLILFNLILNYVFYWTFVYAVVLTEITFSILGVPYHYPFNPFSACLMKYIDMMGKVHFERLT